MNSSPSRIGHLRAVVLLTAITAIACTREQQANVDTAAANIDTAARTALSVIDVDMGRHIGPDKKITDKTDDFARRDTIYASVHTSGTATTGAVVARWTFQDGSVVREQTENVSTAGDAYTAFHIVKAGGFAPGKYTLHVLIDGKEVRTKDVTVK
jgi:hypothetical protein